MQALFRAGWQLTYFAAVKIREKMNEGKTIEVSCRRCHSNGHHLFSRIDLPLLGLNPLGKKIFKCTDCGVEMFEDGIILVTFFDRVGGFIHYPQLMETINELERLLAINQNVSVKHREEILQLKSELFKINSDKELLTIKLRDLIDRIRKEGS